MARINDAIHGKLETLRMKLQQGKVEYAATQYGGRDGTQWPGKEKDDLREVLSAGKAWLKTAPGKTMGKCKQSLEEALPLSTVSNSVSNSYYC